MIPYVIMALFVVVLIVFDDCSKANKKIVLRFLYPVAMILMCVMASIRASNVGSDTSMYMQYFEEINNNSLSDSLATMTYLEPGYVLFNKVVSFFSSNPQAITIANSVLLYIVFGVCLRSSSKDKLLALFLFITMGFFQTSFNITRSCIAVFIGYIGIEKFSKNKILAILLFILAFLFHKSIIVLLPVLVLERIPLKKKYIKYYLLLAVMLFFMLDMLMPILNGLVSSGYSYYVEKGTEGVIEKVSPLLIHLAIFIFAIWRIKDTKEYISSHRRYFVFLFLEIVFYLFSIKYSMFTRVAYIFSMYNVISIPNIVEDNPQEKRMKVKYSIISFCLAQYIVRLMINNIGKTIPYENFMEMELSQ